MASNTAALEITGISVIRRFCRAARRLALTALLATIAGGAVASQASATVTIGSNLGGIPDNGGGPTIEAFPTKNDPGCNAGAACSATNLALPASHQSGGGLTSPVNGTVTSWVARANTGNGISLQVLRQVSGITYSGVATSAPQSWPAEVSPTFPTSLPIQRGDTIGLLNPNQDLVYAETPGATSAAWYLAPGGPLADGTTRAADAIASPREVLVRAFVEPTNMVTLGALTVSGKNGTATQTVSVPNPGQLSYSGTGVNVTGPASVAAPGDIQVTVRATGKKRKKLNKKGKVSVSIATTFTPNFGAARTAPTNLTLRKELKKK
jgi:hypothetical protein